MLEGLTAWHERNPLLDAFCEGMDDPSPWRDSGLEVPAFGADGPPEGKSPSPADGGAEALRWY